MSGLLSEFATRMHSKLTAKWTEVQWAEYGKVTSLISDTPEKESFSGEEYDLYFEVVASFGGKEAMALAIVEPDALTAFVSIVEAKTEKTIKDVFGKNKSLKGYMDRLLTNMIGDPPVTATIVGTTPIKRKSPGRPKKSAVKVTSRTKAKVKAAVTTK